MFLDDRATDLAFLGKKFQDLTLLLQAQAGAVYQSRGMVFPVVTSATLLILGRQGAISQASIARLLDRPHQLVSQRIRNLEKLDLVTKAPSPEDARVSLFSLTPEGKRQYDMLESYCEEAAHAFEALSRDLGFDLPGILDRTLTSLTTRPLSARLERYPQAKPGKARRT